MKTFMTLLVTISFLVGGCGQEAKKISGVYVRESDTMGAKLSHSYDFREDGSVLYEGKGMTRNSIRRKGTWKLESGKLVASMWDEELKMGEDDIFSFEGTDLILTATRFQGKTTDGSNHRFRKQ